jgi:hypothetical protein
MNFQEAIADYRFLKNRGYPDKAALKLVSDHFRLSALERNCLFRAVFAVEDCERRRAKLVHASALSGRELGVDWYNVLITVESYLKGFPVFLADDGLARDSSGIHGSYRPSKVTPAAVGKILTALANLKPGRLDLFLDAPISFSGVMADSLRERLAALHIAFAVEVHPSADYPLKSFLGVVASSDSSIIDREGVQEVLDLARYVLESAFAARIRTVEELALEASP